MTELTNRQALAWCLTLALGLSLFGLGVVLCLRLTIQMVHAGAHDLFRVGGLLALFLGALFLAITLASRRASRIAASLLLLVSALILAISCTPQALSGLGLPATVSTLPALPVLVMVGAVGALLGMQDHPSVKGVRIAASVLLAGGLINLIPDPSIPDWMDLTAAPNLAMASAVFLVLFGALLPLIPALSRSRRGVYCRPVFWLGVVGMSITLAGWHMTQAGERRSTERQADLIASGMTEAIESFHYSERAAVRRMAERFEVRGRDLSVERWQAEVEDYFRDLPHLEMVAILDQRADVQRLSLRDSENRRWVDETLNSEEFRQWYTSEFTRPGVHSSSIYTGPDGEKFSFVAAPIQVGETRRWSLLALEDTESSLNWLASRPKAGLNLSVTSQQRTLFDSQRVTPDHRQIVARKLIDLPHDQWTLTLSRSRYGSYLGNYLTATLILFGGLALTTLIMISRLFGVIAADHNQRLQNSNLELQAYLRREKDLRETSRRIIEFTSDLLCSIDQHGYFQFVSPASQRILGYTPDEMVDRRTQDFVCQADWEESHRATESLRQGRQIDTLTLRNRYWHREGYLVTLDWKVQAHAADGTLFCVGRDVSAELKAKELAQQREAFFSITPEMFCIVAEDHFAEINHAFLATLGYSRDELLGRPYLDIIHPNFHPVIATAVEQLMTGKNIYELETQVLHSSGSRIWLRLNAAMRNHRIFCSARDITREKAVQQDLQEKNQVLSLAERMGRLGGWMFDLRSKRLVWSDTVCDIHDLPHGEVPPLEMALDFYTPEFRPQIEESVKLAAESGLPYDLELQIISAKGQLRWVRSIGQAMRNNAGEIVALQGAFQDITESKEASEQIRRLAERQATIFESITDAFFTMDREWRISFVNQKTEELIGVSRGDVLGKSLWDLYPELLGSEFHQQFHAAVDSGETASFEAYFGPRDLWCEMKAYPSEEGLAVYFRSINARRRAEQQRDATMAELERSNRELQDFAFVASHDLQEPLRKIQTFSDRLLQSSDHLDEREQDYLQRMHRAARRMQTLILDLLSYSRLSTRTQAFQHCNLNRILEEVLQDLETAIAESDAGIEVSELPEMKGDPSQLRQLLQNLLSNSLKFRRPDEALKICVYAENITAKEWTLVVKDNGAGFDARYADRLFQPFQRLHSRSEYAGTGIGLAIVRRIVERHQGFITAEGKPGAGATFRIRFEILNSTQATRGRRTALT